MTLTFFYIPFNFKLTSKTFLVQCKCGVTFLGNSQNRIFGGIDAQPGEIPWQVQLHYNGSLPSLTLPGLENITLPIPGFENITKIYTNITKPHNQT